jgi:hypothetical protein
MHPTSEPEPAQAIRVTMQGPRLPVRVPEIPAVVAVGIMCAAVAVLTVLAAVAVLMMPS